MLEILVIVWFTILVAIFVPTCVIVLIQNRDSKRDSKRAKRIQYINSIKIRCPGHIINYFSVVRQRDENYQFLFLDDVSMRFFCRVRLDDEAYNVLAYNALKDIFSDPDKIREAKAATLLNGNAVMDSATLDALFVTYIATNDPMDIMIPIEQYRSVDKGEEQAIPVTVEVCPFKCADATEFRADVFSPLMIEDVGFSIGFDNNDDDNDGDKKEESSEKKGDSESSEDGDNVRETKKVK
jgi:hypothetical protein